MNLLFICTHNRCRSILSEAVTNHVNRVDNSAMFTAYSAGSSPVGQVYPLVLTCLAEKGIDTSSLKSQSWDEFEAEQPDIVITVCDKAASETCPVWFGDCLQAHWGLHDPSSMDVDDDEKKRLLFELMDVVAARIEFLKQHNFVAQSNMQQQALLIEASAINSINR